MGLAALAVQRKSKRGCSLIGTASILYSDLFSLMNYSAITSIFTFTEMVLCKLSVAV